MNSDEISFITNEHGHTLVDRFNDLLSGTDSFDCLVGYFYVSGFYQLQEKLKEVDKIRILVGMGIDSQTFHLVDGSNEEEISTAEFRKGFSKDIIEEMNHSENSSKVE